MMIVKLGPNFSLICRCLGCQTSSLSSPQLPRNLMSNTISHLWSVFVVVLFDLETFMCMRLLFVSQHRLHSCLVAL